MFLLKIFFIARTRENKKKYLEVVWFYFFIMCLFTHTINLSFKILQETKILIIMK